MPFLHFLAAHRTPFLDAFFQAVSEIGRGYIILSLGVHRNLAKKIREEGKPWRSSVFTVDYVRVYQKKKR